MTTASNPYRGFRYPAEVIQHAVWLYHCFSLSLRDVETILAACGIIVSYESIREWGLRFGRLFANELKRRRPRPGNKWHLDEVLTLSALPRTFSFWVGSIMRTHRSVQPAVQGHSEAQGLDRRRQCAHGRE